MMKAFAVCIALCFVLCTIDAQTTPASVSLPPEIAGAPASRSADYTAVQQRLQQGWNTWDTNTIGGEVLLPEGLEIRLSLKQNSTLNGDSYLPNILIGRQGNYDEQVKPGPHAYDGSYSSFEVTWANTKTRVEAAHAGDDLVILVTPLGPTGGSLPHTALFSVGFLWNRPGHVAKEMGRIVASAPGRNIPVYLAATDSNYAYTSLQSPYFSADLTVPVGISTGKPRTVEEIERVVSQQHQAFTGSHQKNPAMGSVLEAIETTLAWDTIYEPHGKRVISPVSRIWNVMWGGYVLFDWDTFFAADLAAVGSKDLAYANALEILNEATPAGFVPNYGRAGNWKSFDRSEPPVGAITVWALYQKFHDRWLLRDSFDRLLRWNRWWTTHRDVEGYLVWGSDGENFPANLDDSSRGTLQGAKFESGIDNGPQFDSGNYNPATHAMELADVGLMSLYIADCNALAAIADTLGKKEDADALRASGEKYRRSLAHLWDGESGMFLNRDLRSGTFVRRISPTNFYPLLAKVATTEQAEELVKKHLLNAEEMWGERVLPAIARNDPAFKDQDYWRGRIWGPMNYLVYEGLRNYDTPSAESGRQQLAEKSRALFQREWTERGHVHENYSAISEDSDNVPSSDRFYHWGALLGLIEYEELTRSK